MARSINARLQRLEAEADRPHVAFRVRWAEDEDEPEPEGPVIRLRWGDDREPPERGHDGQIP
jgi:hypothetical protein